MFQFENLTLHLVEVPVSKFDLYLCLIADISPAAMDAKQIIMGQVFPIVGGVLATIMYCSPVKATYVARKNGALGVSSGARTLQREQQLVLTLGCLSRH